MPGPNRLRRGKSGHAVEAGPQSLKRETTKKRGIRGKQLKMWQPSAGQVFICFLIFALGTNCAKLAALTESRLARSFCRRQARFFEEALMKRIVCWMLLSLGAVTVQTQAAS